MTPTDYLRLAKEHGATVTLEGDRLKLSGPEPLPADIMEGLRAHKVQIMELVRIEDRRKKVLALFEKNPTVKRAFVTDDESDPLHVIVTVGLRTGETGELIIPRASYDPFLFMSCIESFEKGIVQ